MVILAFLTGFICALTAVYLGMRWQQQRNNDEPVSVPTKEEVLSQLFADDTPQVVEQKTLKEWWEGDAGNKAT